MNPPNTRRNDAVLRALAKAVSLLEQAEYSGSCNSEGDCHGCAWDSDRDILVDKWRHLLR